MNDSSQKMKKMITAGVLVIATAVAVFAIAQGDRVTTFLAGVPNEGQGVTLVVETGSGFANPMLLSTEEFRVNVLLNDTQNGTLTAEEVEAVTAELSFSNDTLEIVDIFFASDPIPPVAFEIATNTYDHADAADKSNYISAANTAGAISLSGARGLSESNSTPRVATITMKPKAIGQASITVNHDGRGEGPSYALASLSGGEPVDILDGGTVLNFQVTDPKPEIASLTYSSGNIEYIRDARVLLVGKNLTKKTVLQLYDYTGSNKLETLDILSVADDGKSAIIHVPKELGKNYATKLKAFNGEQGSNVISGFSYPKENIVIPEDYYAIATSIEPNFIPADSIGDLTVTINGEHLDFTDDGRRRSVPEEIRLISDDQYYLLGNKQPTEEDGVTVAVTATLPFGELGSSDAHHITQGGQPMPVGKYDLQLKSYSGQVTTFKNYLTVGEQVAINGFEPSILHGNTEGIGFSILSNFVDVGPEEISITLSNTENSYTLNAAEISGEDNEQDISGTINDQMVPGVYNLAVVINDENFELEEALTVDNPLVPTLGGISPSEIEVGYEQPFQISLIGENLVDESPVVRLVSDGGVVTLENIVVGPLYDSITATTPVGLGVGEYDVEVSEFGQPVDHSIIFTVLEPLPVTLPPAPESLAPTSVTTKEVISTDFQLVGESFINPEVRFVDGDQEFVTDINSSSDAEITFRATDQIPEGEYDVMVTNEDQQTAQLSRALTVLAEPLPTITYLSPNSVDDVDVVGTILELQGQNYYEDSTVRLVSSSASVELSDVSVNEERTLLKATINDTLDADEYQVEVGSASRETVVTAPIGFVVNETPQSIFSPELQFSSDGSSAVYLEARWSAPATGQNPSFYQYQIKKNGEVIRDWEEKKIFDSLAIKVNDFQLVNGENYEILVRSALSTDEGYVASDPVSSGTFVIRSGNINYDSEDKVNFADLIAIFRSWGPTTGHADINRDGKVDFGDIREWSLLR